MTIPKERRISGTRSRSSDCEKYISRHTVFTRLGSNFEMSRHNRIGNSLFLHQSDVVIIDDATSSIAAKQSTLLNGGLQRVSDSATGWCPPLYNKRLRCIHIISKMPSASRHTGLLVVLSSWISSFRRPYLPCLPLILSVLA